VCVLEIRSYILVAYIMRKVAVCTLMTYRTERHDIKILLHSIALHIKLLDFIVLES